MRYRITTQAQVRREFWLAHPDRRRFPRRRITHYSGNGKMHVTDVRCAFADFVDYLSKNGSISQELAQRVTL